MATIYDDKIEGNVEKGYKYCDDNSSKKKTPGVENDESFGVLKPINPIDL